MEKPPSNAAGGGSRELCPCPSALPLFAAPHLRGSPSPVQVRRGAAGAPAAAAPGRAEHHRPLFRVVPGKGCLHTAFPPSTEKNRLLSPGGFYFGSSLSQRKVILDGKMGNFGFCERSSCGRSYIGEFLLAELEGILESGIPGAVHGERAATKGQYRTKKTNRMQPMYLLWEAAPHESSETAPGSVTACSRWRGSCGACHCFWTCWETASSPWLLAGADFVLVVCFFQKNVEPKS